MYQIPHNIVYWIAVVGPNGCGRNNGGCEEICVPTPDNNNKCLFTTLKDSMYSLKKINMFVVEGILHEI